MTSPTNNGSHDDPPARGTSKGGRVDGVKRVIDEVTTPGLVHPALIPGIGVEKTGRVFPMNWGVFIFAAVVAVGVITWAFAAPESISTVGGAALGWVSTNFGWLFSALAIVVILYMLVVGYGRSGGVRLGSDDEQPEFSTTSWIAMLFSAGIAW